MDTPVTEQQNSLTLDIDLQSAEDIVELLQNCDGQIFDGWNSKGLKDESFIDKVLAVSAILRLMLADDTSDNSESMKCKRIVVFSGCGTSGRIAFITCRSLNAHLKRCGKRPVFRYLLAGGDKALFTSQEKFEDDSHVGIADLIKCCAGTVQVLYIGITCGLSAAYVAGQLHYCMQHLHTFTPVLIGFNPVNLARKSPINNWNKTFYQVVQSMTELEDAGAYVLNPIIGPEPIAGSTRMKGGSATKIILELLYLLAHLKPCSCHDDYRLLLSQYEMALKKLYSESKHEIIKLVKMAASSLCSDGCVCYIASDMLGILAMVDASECVPTYGSDLNDVRGWIAGGYKTLQNREGDLECLGENYIISLEYFLEQKMPLLSSNDTIIIIHKNELDELLDNSKYQETGCAVASLQLNHIRSVRQDTSNQRHSLTISSHQAPTGLPFSQLFSNFLLEISVKWICNAISTGAHVLKGKVFSNIMIDVRISNVKLYRRALAIIQRVTGCTFGQAKRSLCTAVYGDDDEFLSLSEFDQIYAIINKVTNMNRIVPITILMLCGNISRQAAVDYLAAETSVRKVIASFINKSK